jgi:hypothetical protein
LHPIHNAAITEVGSFHASLSSLSSNYRSTQRQLAHKHRSDHIHRWLQSAYQSILLVGAVEPKNRMIRTLLKNTLRPLCDAAIDTLFIGSWDFLHYDHILRRYAREKRIHYCGRTVL